MFILEWIITLISHQCYFRFRKTAIVIADRGSIFDKGNGIWFLLCSQGLKCSCPHIPLPRSAHGVCFEVSWQLSGPLTEPSHNIHFTIGGQPGQDKVFRYSLYVNDITNLQNTVHVWYFTICFNTRDLHRSSSESCCFRICVELG